MELLRRAHVQAKPQNQESYLEELVYCVNKAQAGREESLVYEQLPLPQFDERGLHVNFHVRNECVCWASFRVGG